MARNIGREAVNHLEMPDLIEKAAKSAYEYSGWGYKQPWGKNKREKEEWLRCARHMLTAMGPDRSQAAVWRMARAGYESSESRRRWSWEKNPWAQRAWRECAEGILSALPTSLTAGRTE
jgi:hypothetical protein